MVRSVFARLLDKIAPPLSIRHQFLLLAKQTPQTVRSNGPIVAAQHLLNAFQNYRRTGALLIAPPPMPYFYTDWIDDNELSPAQLKLQVSATNSLVLHPLFSVIVPVYNPPLAVFRAALESVCDQTYNNWELCIANGGDDVDIRSYLDRLSAEDSRIKVCHLLQNGGISANSNQALALALGEFIVLLDHDDTLAPNLLYEVASIINQQSDVDVVYFDEDKLSADGAVRSAAWFKPQWSPDLMLSTNLLMHSVMRRTLVESVGRFDSTMDGAQDWDLALRVSGCTTKITHIAKVLYHWRQITGSVASDPNAKPWAYPAQERCFQAHLARIGEAEAKLTFPQQGTPRIFFPIRNAKVSILIPTKDKVDLLRACISSILEKTTYHNYEIVVIDTGSREDSTRDYYRTLVNEQRVRILEFHGRFNWSSVNNFGAQQTTGEIILCLNNDTEVINPQWLEEMVGWAMRPHIGVVGTRLLYADGKIQHQGIVLGLAGHGSHLFDGGNESDYGIFGSTEWGRNCLAVTGACLMVRRDLFEKLQGFDEVYEIAYSDIEFCLRAHDLGYRNFCTPFARLFHYQGATRGLYQPLNDVLRFTCQILQRVRAGDPYFNPNLSYLSKLPSFAQPGELSPAQQLIDILEKNDCLPKGLPSSVVDTLFDTWPIPQPWPNRRKKPSSTRRILLVSHELSVSGAPLTLCELGKYLVDQGYEVTVFSPFDGPALALFDQANIPVSIEPIQQNPSANAIAIAQLVSNYDLVIANTVVSYRAIFTAKAFDLPVIAWIHESQKGVELCQTIHHLGLSLHHADCLVFPTEANAKLYHDFVDLTQQRVIPVGRDIHNLDLIEPIEPVRDQRIRIVCLGTLEFRKGQDILLRSIAALPATLQQKIELVLAGRSIDNEFLDTITSLMQSLPNVVYLGEIPRTRAMAYLCSTDLFVLPSRDEVLPGILLEAMYHKRAIIATQVGGIPEVITDGVHGLLVDVDDPQALGVAIVRLIDDPAFCQQLGKNAQQRFHQSYTIDKMGQAFVETIEQLLNS